MKSRPIDQNPNLAARLWPADKVERRSVDSLIPFARNARTHTDADVDVLAEAMVRFGFTNPVLVTPIGGIIAGHCRVLAAKKAGYATVPVMVAEGWSDAEISAYCLADNQIAARAGWNLELLRKELAAAAEAGIAPETLGFDGERLSALLGNLRSGQVDPEIAPEAPETPVSRVGDTWRLKNHRVRCGDSTDPLAVADALGDLHPHLMVTDPPYGVNYDPAWRTKLDGKGVRAIGKVINDDRADWREAWANFKGGVAYIWHAGLFAGVVADSLIATGLEPRSQIIWVKSHFTLGRSDYHWRHEACLYAVRKGGDSHWASDRRQTTVWEIANNNAFGNQNREKVWGHGTQKPIETMRRPIENSSKPGDAVFDPFLGSGTTLIAADIMGRTCIGLELSPIYVDVIVRRWQEFSGNAAILDADGLSFAEVAAARGVKVGN